MEETLTTDSPVPAEPHKIIVLQEGQSYLITAGKWAQFFGVIGFIISGLLICAAIFVGAFSAAMPRFFPAALPSMFGGLMAFFYVLGALVHFAIALYLYQFGSTVKDGARYGNSGQVTAGLGKLKSAFKLAGITTIAVIVLYFVMIFAVVIFASHMVHQRPAFN